MKNLKLRIIAVTWTIVVLCGIGGAPAAFSQSSAMTAHVPFDFYVDTKLMPAGNYRVKPVDSGSTFMRISDDNGNTIIVGTIPGSNGQPLTGRAGRLVFNRYGSVYFLSELDWAGAANGHSLQKSSYERELIAAISRSQVTLAAK